MNSFRHTLITGTSRGLGLEISRCLLETGSQVVQLNRVPRLDDANDCVTCDLSQPTDIDKVVAQIRERGRAQFSAVICNAAVWPGVDLSEPAGHAEALNAYAVNALGHVVLLDKLAGAGLLENGCLVLAISSGMASISTPPADSMELSYTMSKAALNAGMRALERRERPREMRVRVVDPGWMRTRLGGPDAPLSPSEAAAALLSAPYTDLGGLFFRPIDQSVVPW